jgi:hypothetical protein
MATTARAPEVRRTPAPTSRKRTTGLWMATALVIGNMIGSGERGRRVRAGVRT